jgi:hypothetical protein
MPSPLYRVLVLIHRIVLKVFKSYEVSRVTNHSIAKVVVSSRSLIKNFNLNLLFKPWFFIRV